MFETIKKDLTTAMKEQDKFKLDVIRMLKSALQLESIAKKHDLSDEEVIAVIKRETKKRASSIEEYKKYGKTDTVESLKKEIEILSVYLPEELSDDELNRIIEETIKELNAESIKDMGNVIKTVGSKVGSSADMGKVSKIVKEKLS
ncbi:MAG: GatB/YqeY domain-containing protein [Erysipelotrichales bacterium]|nr:GatB/YqeY domain-containing protein [Erysipelotrichales bacterium]